MINPISARFADDRLTELETRVAFQDHTIGELNDVVTGQSQRIAHLERELTVLKTQMKTMAPSLIASASEETPPPHY